MAVNWRCKTCDQFFDNILVRGHSQELFLIFIVKRRWLLPDTAFQTLIVHDIEWNQIQMCFEYTTNLWLWFDNFLMLDSVNTHYLDPITGFDHINVVIIGYNWNWMRSLAFGYVFGHLLELYELFICKLAQVVNQLKALLRKTFRTSFGLLYSCVFKHDSHLRLAFDTFEKGPFHLWHDVTCPYNNSSERNEFIDFSWPNGSHYLDITDIFDRNHDPIPFGLFFLILLRTQMIAHVHFFKQTLDNFIKAHDHFSRKVDKLVVQIPIKLFQMLSWHRKYLRLHDVHLGKLRLIDTLRLLLGRFRVNLKLLDETLKRIVYMSGGYVCAIDHVHLLAGDGFYLRHLMCTACAWIVMWAVLVKTVTHSAQVWSALKWRPAGCQLFWFAHFIICITAISIFLLFLRTR